jgi:UDP-N-acetylglucosamine--N-acetylmuramyl-(pentapeptide) pyrophosphoryl-undecaprenol N-acetylglucosamine transferase
VFLSFPEAARRVGGSEKKVVGTPIRKTMQQVEKTEARRQFGLEPDRQTLFISGGSQGSVSINEAVGEALPALMGQDLQVLWQAGRTDPETPAEMARDWPGRVVVVPFIDNMAAAYSAADLALTRSGALTLTELNHMGLPAILVPLPWSAENHQEYNARALEGAGAAQMILQADLDGGSLAEAVLGLLGDGAQLERMARHSRALAVGDAADRLVAHLVEARILHV